MVPVVSAQARQVERRVEVCVDRVSARLRFVSSENCRASEVGRSWPVSGPAPQLCSDAARRLSVAQKGRCADSSSRLIRMREGARFVACANRETGEMRRPSSWSNYTCAATSRTLRWVSVPRKVPATTSTSTTSTTTAAPSAAVAAAPAVATLGLGYANDEFSLALSGETLAPTVTNGTAASYAVSGTLPTGVSFDTATGEFTGAVAWNKPLGVISAGYEMACAVTTAGGAKCWGRGMFYGVGDGTLSNRYAPVDVTGLTSGVESIDAGYLHACALTTAGGVKCWGSNGNGELGDGSVTASTVPVQVLGLTSGVTAVRTSKVAATTCALRTFGDVLCWGRNDFGQLGDGGNVDSSVPAAVAGLTGVTQIAVGGAHACALLGDGTVQCWGQNVVGQLGDGSYINRLVPVAVSGISNATAIGAGTQHTCALLATGAVQCWGNNLNDAIGLPSLGSGDTNVPVTVDGLSSGVARLSVGQAYNCVIMTDSRELRCWGSNNYGNLGVGDTTNRGTPTAVVDMASDVQSVSAGGWVTCAVMNTGNQGRCWGFGSFGALGNGGSSSSSSPVNVSGTGANAGFPAAVSVTVTATSGSTATWSGTLRISGPVG